MPEDEMRKGPF